MHENISFLFLFSLAFCAWIVLCYLHVVDEQKRTFDYRVELYSENPGIVSVLEPSQKITTLGASTKGDDLILNFIFIFGGTVLLSKLLQWLEIQLRKFIQRRAMTFTPVPDDTSAVINERHMGAFEEIFLNRKDGPTYQYPDENNEMKHHLNTLEARCLEMQQLLQDIRSSTSIDSRSNSELSVCSNGSGFRPFAASVDGESEGDSESYNCTSYESFNMNYGAGSSGIMMLNETTSTTSLPTFKSLKPNLSPKHNVFVNNRHIHINFNGNVNFSENIVNVDMRRQALLYTQKQSEFLQVWSKFIAGPKGRRMLPDVQTNSTCMLSHNSDWKIKQRDLMSY